MASSAGERYWAEINWAEMKSSWRGNPPGSGAMLERTWTELDQWQHCSEGMDGGGSFGDKDLLEAKVSREF